MIELTLNKILIDEKRSDQVVVFREKKGNRLLPLVIGLPEAQSIQLVAQSIGGAGNPAQYLIAQRYLESLGTIATGADKVVFMPYEASGALASLGGIKELLTQK